MSVFHNVPGVPRKKMERFHLPGAKALQMRDFLIHPIQNRTPNARFRYNARIFILYTFL
jgi:hypothetical protein